MNILQICNKPPYPPQDGGAIGMHNITQGLIDAGCHVKVLAVNTPKHFVDIDSLPQKYRDETSIEFGFIDTDLKPFEAFKNLVFTNRSYNIVRFEDNSFKQLLIRILKKDDYDVVQIESIFLNYYIDTIREHSKAKIVLRAPNVEFMIWKRMANEERSVLKKFYLKILASRLEREETKSLNKFDAVYTVTQNDKEIFQQLDCHLPITYIPTGVDVTKEIQFNQQAVEYPSVFHIGALDWMPNQEGLSWFLDRVWIKLSNQFPKLKFFIAGRGDASWLDTSKYSNVDLLGEIDDAAAFIKSKAIMIVPLFSGSGMRVKIIEGMTFGKVIVSTSIGVEGIIHQHERDIIISDTAEGFFKAISKMVVDKAAFETLAKNAVINVNKEYSNTVLTQKLISFLNSII